LENAMASSCILFGKKITGSKGGLEKDKKTQATIYKNIS
jgi:hypothetical protein